MNLESNINTEVAAPAAPASPKQVRVFRFITIQKLSICGDNLCLNQVIASETEFSPVKADSSPEKEPRYPYSRARTCRHNESKRRRGSNNIAELGTGTDVYYAV